MDCKELQEEEVEVLASIYDGDLNFKQISPTSFQYKIGSDSDPKSFLLEISWVKEYPNISPLINLDAFYNKKLIPEVKSIIVGKLQEEAEQQVGMPMTYTLFEWAKDNAEQLTKSQPDKPPVSLDNASYTEEKIILDEMVSSSSKKEMKKPKLSKQQKRKLAEKLDSRGEHPRGWDWVDVVKHLSQIGSKQNDSTS